ncbi:MAG: T9SS type A sorting domain-containing protein [Bacteroidetes bacterium]|nr:T9SS type A sorting domain-containing protein [Bacteroidota bacterium]
MRFFLTFLVVSLFLPLSAKAQFFLNAGFEEWEDIADYENPKGWQTTNLEGFASVYKSDSPFTGNFAALLTAGVPTIEGPGPGRMWIDIPASEGIPSHLKVYVKHNNFSDSSRAEIYLTVNAPDYNKQHLLWSNQSEIEDWELLNIPINYEVNTQEITEVRLEFAGGSIITPLGPAGNGDFSIDNIQLTGVSTGLQQVAPEEAEMKIYPLPAQDEITLDLRQLPYGWYDIEILDMQGRRLYFLREAGSYNKHKIAVHLLPTGQYILVARNDQQEYLGRLQIVR